MDANSIESALQLIAGQAAAITGQLVPVGMSLVITFITLGVLFLSFSIGNGTSSLLGPVVRFSGAAYATRWAIENWADLARDALEGARAMTARLIPGYGGPGDLFEAAMNIGERMVVEQVAWSWASPVASAIAGALASLLPVLVVIGLTIPAILAVLAEFQLLMGAAIAPLVLPMLAFPITAPLGWGVIQFMVSQSVAVIALGATSVMIRTAMERVIQVPGSDEGLTGHDVFTLLILATIALIAGFGATTMARNLVGGSMGALGLGTAMRAGGMVAGIGHSFMSVGSAVKSAVSGGKGGAASTAARAGSSSGSGSSPAFSMSRSSGSPFRP